MVIRVVKILAFDGRIFQADKCATEARRVSSSHARHRGAADCSLSIRPLEDSVSNGDRAAMTAPDGQHEASRTMLQSKDIRFSVAPMMDWTDLKFFQLVTSYGVQNVCRACSCFLLARRSAPSRA
jgi:hypothetical protein